MRFRRLLRIVVPALVFLTGLSVLFYPVFSDLWNQRRQNALIEHYEQQVAQMTEEDDRSWRAAAEAYNAALDPSFYDAFHGAQPEADDQYWSLLNLDGTGIMGYLEIPKISVRLPIYHGTGEDSLQHGVGHLAGTSLPVGGLGTHSVLSAHRGLPSAMLFTDLDQVQTGDRFYISILRDTLVYEVDQILVVTPDEVSSLRADPAEDYVTLVTCTPYGVNSHRLLVRGRRVEETAEEAPPAITAVSQLARSLGWRAKLLIALGAVFGFLLVVLLVRAVVRKHGKK